MNKIQKSLLVEARNNIDTDPVYAKELLFEAFAMEVDLGTKGLHKSYQEEFTETVPCVHCGGEARIAFVAHEFNDTNKPQSMDEMVTNLHPNDPDGEGCWVHDAASFATYLCKDCLEPTTKYTQA